MCYLWYARWISRDIITQFPNPSIIRFSILDTIPTSISKLLTHFTTNPTCRTATNTTNDWNANKAGSAIPVAAGRSPRLSSCTASRADGSVPAARGRSSRGCCRRAAPAATSPPSSSYSPSLALPKDQFFYSIGVKQHNCKFATPAIWSPYCCLAFLFATMTPRINSLRSNWA